MISGKSVDGDIYVKTVDNFTLYDTIEEDVKNTIEAYTHEDVLALDGTAGAPSIAFASDPDSGLYRLTGDNIGITTGGSRAMNFSGSITSSAQKLRCEYLSGSTQFCLENASLSDSNIILKSDANDDFIIENNNATKDIILQTSNGGQTVIRPFDTTITNVDFCVFIGDGASSYTAILQVNESAIRSRKAHNFIDGSISAPGITFNNDPDTGVRRITTDNLSLVCGGFDILDLSLAACTLLTDNFTHKPSTVLTTTTDFTVQVGDGISTYTNLFHIDENAITASVDLKNEDGSTLRWSSADFSLADADFNDGTNTFTGVTGSGHYNRNSFVSGSTDWLDGYLTVSWTGKGSATGNMLLEPGIPICGADSNTPVTISYNDGITCTGRLTAEFVAGTDEIIFYDQVDDGTAPTQLTAAAFDTAGTLRMGFSFPINERL